MAQYVYNCINASCPARGKQEIRIVRYILADIQACKLCDDFLVREEIAHTGPVWIDKAYRPAAKGQDGKAIPTEGASRKGLKWY